MTHRRNHPVIAGGALITLCGIGHSLGALIQVAPHHGKAWLDGALWEPVNGNPAEFTPVLGAFWYTHYSFGFPLLMLGGTCLAIGWRGMAPPRVIAGFLMLWAVVGAVASGPSPLLLLVPAGVLLLVGASRRGTAPVSSTAALRAGSTP